MQSGLSKFIITGLPRSRTSWLANLFTYGSSFCMHDGLATGNDFFCRLRAVAASDSSIRYVGNSDSGIPMFMPPSEFDDCKVLVVLRDKKECFASFQSYFTEHPYPSLATSWTNRLKDYFDLVSNRLKEFYREIPSERLQLLCFHHLDNAEVVARAWKFLVPDEPFNFARFEILNKMRVNPASEKWQWTSDAKPLAIT